jgi:hypothetical protein
MNATAHPVAPEELMAFLDGELSADRTQAVSAHLESCDDCRSLADEMRHISLSLDACKVDAFPPSIENQVQAAAAKGVTPGRFNLFLRATFWTWKQWAGGAAALGAAAILLVLTTAPTLLRHKIGLDQITETAQQPAPQVARGVSVDNSSVSHQPITDQQSKGQGTVGKLTTLATPGAATATDSNGLLHGLGDHAENSFSVDGQPMIARTISLSVITKDFDASRKSLDAILTSHNGYAAGLNVSTPQSAARSLQASLRVPAPQLAAALVELKSLGRVETESQNGEEVTQQHADLVARLKNSRETEQRLQAILVQRTGKISDVLEVEQEIARVRGEIEQMEAEQKNLEHRVDFATIDLKLAEEYKATLDSPAPSVATQFHNALINGYTSATDSLLGLLLFFVQYSPVLLLWIAILSSPAWLLWRRWKRASAAV